MTLRNDDAEDVETGRGPVLRSSALSCGVCVGGMAAPLPRRELLSYLEHSSPRPNAEPGLVTMSVNPIDTDTARVGRLLRRLGMTSPMLLVPREVASALRIQGYPTLMLVHGTSCRILWQSTGFVKR